MALSYLDPKNLLFYQIFVIFMQVSSRHDVQMSSFVLILTSLSYEPLEVFQLIFAVMQGLVV